MHKKNAIDKNLPSPSWSQITSHDHESGPDAKSSCPGIEVFFVQLHDQEYFNQEQRTSQQPIHVTASIVKELPSTADRHDA